MSAYDSARLAPPQSLKRPLTMRELEACWADLLVPSHGQWRQSGWSLVAAAKQAVPYLRVRVRPVPRQDPQRIARLIAALSDQKFAVRQQAAVDLEKLEELAEPALRKALAAKPPLETTRRLEALLDILKRRSIPPERRRVLRAIEILGAMTTSEARQVLQKLADGDPASAISQAAQEQLGKRSPADRPRGNDRRE